MKKYNVSVKETSYGSIEVEANSKEEAEDIAYGEYERGNTVWDSGEYELSAKEIAPRQRTDTAR